MKKHETYCSYVIFALLGCMSVFHFSHIWVLFLKCVLLYDFLTA